LLTGVDLALPRTIAGTFAMLIVVYGLYAIRLVAFALIIAATIDKTRPGPRDSR
jgi:hypothetical protein